MTYILRIYYHLFLVVALLSSCSGKSVVHGPPETVWAFAGGDAILPCSFNINDRDDFPTVEWSKEGLQPNVVFLYRDGWPDHKSQLHEKEEIIRQPQNIRSQLSPSVSHHDQPTFTDSHTSHRNQSCTESLNNKEPSSSSSANTAKKTSGYIRRSKSMSHSLRPVDHKLQHRRSLVSPSSVVPRLQRNSNEESEHLMS
ncbi:hypothetical protein D9C73_026805 [Collichthys lucidus]|uniref:Uncharacterized protein n=1 Tax=Collichthys lucidus TaxID=240159 RepID=A0A4U5VWK7_COLLU|nr:hypothetical protein D9C73_026805 [Collichthys lucidus]